MRFLILILLFSSNLHAQKHDFIWPFGGDLDTAGFKGACHLDFNSGTAESYRVFREIRFIRTAGSFCDSMGNLFCYTNGCDIMGSDHQLIQGGDSINPGPEAFLWCWDFGQGYTVVNSALFFNFPGSDSLFFIHQRFDEVDSFEWGYSTASLFMSIIDMKANGGHGKVLSKNNLVFYDQVRYGNILTTKHGNGVDWWIIISKMTSNEHIKFILSKKGIRFIGSQAIGPIADNIYTAVRETAFAPDGSKFIIHTARNGSQVFDFGRCSGNISNPREIGLPFHNDSSRMAGASFSPNSRFVYISNKYKLYQFDTWADNIQESRVLIDTYEPFQSPFPTYFYLMELAPDGKIYMNCPNGNNVLHVINEPNKKGKDCDFVQRGFQLPVTNAFQMPSYPPYRLGAMPGGCTSSNEEPEEEASIQLYPNPFSTEIRLKVLEGSNSPWSIQFFDALGREVLREDVNTNGETLIQGLRNHPSGILFYRISDRMNRVVKSGKVVRQ